MSDSRQYRLVSARPLEDPLEVSTSGITEGSSTDELMSPVPSKRSVERANG